MPIAKGFKDHLDRLDHGLSSCQTELKSLYGQATFDKLPSEITFMLERKAIALGHLRDQLRDIPAIMDRVEEEERNEQLRRSHAASSPSDSGKATR